MYEDFDIIIVQKKTNAEAHQQTRVLLEKQLQQLGLSYQFLTLDDIRQKQISYFTPNQKKSGFLPRKKLVIALGGDGTLLHASHYVGNDVRLLGINSSPKTSKGYLCVLKPEKIDSNLCEIIADVNKFKQVKRLQLSEKSLPLCLNDVLVCHSHPAATTRSVLSLTNKKTGQKEFTHLVYSSGLWISTVAGQTAAVSSYGFPKEDEESDTIFVAVREPYFLKNETVYPNVFHFSNQDKALTIESKMSSGLVCVDGHESCASFGMGKTMTFEAPKEGVLRLVL